MFKLPMSNADVRIWTGAIFLSKQTLNEIFASGSFEQTITPYAIEFWRPTRDETSVFTQ